MGTVVNAPFSTDIKSQAAEQTEILSHVPSYLEECESQQHRLPAELQKGTGTCRVRLQSHDCLQTGSGKAKNYARGREGAGMCLQQHVWEQAVIFPKAICESLNLCLGGEGGRWRKRARQRERKGNYWKKQVSLWELQGQQKKKLSTSLLVLAAVSLATDRVSKTLFLENVARI